MEEKSLQAWAQELAGTLGDDDSQFVDNPVNVLQTQHGFHLHDAYREQLEAFTEEERKRIAGIFDEIATSPPQDLYKIYAKYAQWYERFFGWEGMQEEGLRGWFFF
jgi:hypothetical protein